MKPAAIGLIIMSALFLIYIVLTSIFQVQSKTEIDKLTELNTYLEEQAISSNFAWTTADMEIDNLEQIITSKDELILELKVKEQILELYKSAMKNAVTYVYYAQTLLDDAGIYYFEFIAESILEDGYFEDLEDQVELFDYVENGVEDN